MSWLMPTLPSLGWSKPQEPTTDDESKEEEGLDVPPPFPLPNSHQRSQAPASSIPTPTPSFALAPPSPPKEPEDVPSDLNIAILPDSTPLGNMAPPPSTTVKPAFGIQSDEQPKKQKGKGGKVALKPGHSALDWARLTSSGVNLRGKGVPPQILRVTMDELKKHKTPEDAWSAFNGKVYNITPYLPFHPGGEDELMRVAGRDGTKLFMLTHSWVNMEFMMQECMVGVLVRG